MKINVNIPALACMLLQLPLQTPAQTDVNGSFMYKGLSRSYMIHLPPDTSLSDIPVVFNLHFYNSNGFQQQVYSGFDAVADTANIIVVYPDGFGGVWDTVFQNSAVDDIGFISALIDTLALDYHIDTNRIYSIGMSMGGFMSYRLACGLGERIAAIASVGGPVTDSILYQCDNAPLTPLLHIHGTADSTIPFAGAGLYPSVDSTIAYFVKRNACPETPVVTPVPDADTTDGCTAAISYYGLCYDSIEVVLYTILNGGHTWPGSFPFPPLGNTNQDFNASSEIWKFLRKWRLNTNAVVVNAAQERGRASDWSVFPNPSNGIFYVSVAQDEVVKKQHILIYNAVGQIVFSKVAACQPGGEKPVPLDLSYLPAGIYSLRVIVDGGQDRRCTSCVRKVIVYH